MCVRISVVVPVYRTEAYLNKCLNSIRRQTFKDIEIICVDDCSPDESASIIRHHAAEDPRVIFMRHQQNLGLGGARNTAIRAARSDWIVSVDSDDYIHPEMIERLWNATEDGKFDVVSCSFDRVDEGGNLLSTQASAARILINENNSINIFSNVSPSFWNKIWRKSLYVDNNIFFPEHVYYQDTATTPRILAKCRLIKIIEDRLYYYLIRGDSTTYTCSAKHVFDYFKVFEVIVDFLKKNNLLERYYDDFLDYVDRAMRFHAQNVINTNVDNVYVRQYLRYMLKLKIEFVEVNTHIIDKNSEQLFELLACARTKSDLLPPDGKDELPISVIVKTFLRPKMLERFLFSVGNYEEKNCVRFAEIIVGDDSPKDVIGANDRAIRKAKDYYPYLNIKHDLYEENIGLADGRNRLVKKSGCEFILLCDDDFILDDKADIRKALGYVESGEYDMVGGWLKNNYNLKTDEFTYWGACGKLVETDDELIIELDETEHERAEMQGSDYLLNFYVARRQALVNVPWDAELKVEEHQEFFYRFYKSPYKAALCKDLFVRHTADRNDNPVRYNEYRFGKENWEQYLFLALERMGKRRRTINRWRNNEFISWEVDANKRTTKQRSLSLKEAVIGQRVPVENVTPKFENYFFGYYDLQSISECGRYLVCQSAPAIDRLPVVTDTSEITLIDLRHGNPKRVIGKTTAWCHQQGAQLQFLPGKAASVIYNVFNEEERTFQSLEVDFDTGEKCVHDYPIAAISRDGKKGASINFARVFDYRPGYGYNHLPDLFADVAAPEDDGLTVFDLSSGEAELVLSYSQIRDTLAVDWWARFAEDKWVINHVAFSPSGNKILMLIRTFSGDAPFPTFTVVCNADGSNLRRVFGFCSHYHWKDDVTFVASGAPGFTRQKAKTIKVYEVNSETLDYTTIGDGVLRDDGHCSYSPDRSMLLYDSYSNTKFPYRRLQVYDLASQRSIELGYFFSDGRWFNNNSDLRCDLHPRWSSDGKSITFDSIHEGFRGIYSIAVEDVRAAFHSPIQVFNGEDLRKWYTAKYDAPTSVPASATNGTGKSNGKAHNDQFSTYYRDARIAYHAKQYEQALIKFQMGHMLQPHNANLKRCIAETLLHLGRKAEALALLSEARSLIPNNKALNRRLRVLRNPFLKAIYRDDTFEVPRA